MIVELEKLDLVSPERVDMVEECLRNICRIDLAKKVSTYKKTGTVCIVIEKLLVLSLK